MSEYIIKSKEKFTKFVKIDINKKRLVCDLRNENFNNQIKILDTLIKFQNQLNVNMTEIVFLTEHEKLPKELIVKMAEIQKMFNYNAKVCVHHIRETEHSYLESDIEWNLNAIIKANKEIDKVCDFIKNNKFSPFEALAFVHDYVSTLAKYNKSGKGKWNESDQFFVGGYLDLPEIVCAGYSALMEEIINNLKIEGLKCNIVSVDFSNMDEYYTASHARCMITVKDKKYKLDQTIFDDPTWDNNENLNSKYSHFAMSNNCFDNNVNKLYEYYIPVLGTYENNKAKIEYSIDALPRTFNNSKNNIDQKMIEKAFFTVLTAKYSNKNFNQIYKLLQEIAKNSFEEQTERKFDGNLKTKNVQLSIKEAKEIYTKIINKVDNNEFNI